jgi:WD40 repeat protein
MSDETFETRLTRELGAYADSALRPIDASVLSERSIRRRGAFVGPARLRWVVVAAALGLLLVALFLLGPGSRRAPLVVGPVPSGATPRASAAADSPSPTVEPPPARTGQLAYTADGDVFLADSDGTKPIKIADGDPDRGTGFDSVAWSPDGRLLAYGGRSVVSVTDSTGTVQFSVGGCCGTWSPDGSLLATLSSTGAGSKEVDGTTDFVILDRDGSVYAWLSVPGRPNFLSTGVQIHWTPDGRSISVTGLGAAISGRLLPIDGGEPTTLPIAPAPGSTGYLSPDRTRIIGLQDGRLVTAAADGTGARQVLSSDAVPPGVRWNGVLWAPDGTRIAAVGSTASSETLYLIDLVNGTVRIVQQNPSTDQLSTPISPQSWSDTLDRILFSSGTDLWMTGPDGSDARVIARNASHGKFQPTGGG